MGDYSDYGHFYVEGIYEGWDVESDDVTDAQLIEVNDKWDNISRATAAKLEAAYNFCDVDPAKLEDKRLSEVLRRSIAAAEFAQQFIEALNEWEVPEIGHRDFTTYDDLGKLINDLKTLQGDETT